MREYLLVWRAFPKLLIGTVFLAELSLLIFGDKAMISLEIAMRKLFTNFSGATLLLTIVLAFGVAASLGLFVLQVASAAARTAARFALRLVPVRLRTSSSFLRDFFESPYAMALRRFQEEADFYSQFCELKSASFSTDALGKMAEIRAHFSAVRSHLLSGHFEDIEAINYYGLLGQDRRTYEIAEGEIQALVSFCHDLAFVACVTSAIRGSCRVANDYCRDVSRLELSYSARDCASKALSLTFCSCGLYGLLRCQ